MRLLLVERESNFGEVLERWAASGGHGVTVRARDACGALEAAARFPADAAIVDMTRGLDMEGLVASACLSGRHGMHSLLLVPRAGLPDALRGVALASLRAPLTRASLTLALAAVEAVLRGAEPEVVPIGMSIATPPAPAIGTGRRRTAASGPCGEALTGHPGETRG